MRLQQLQRQQEQLDRERSEHAARSQHRRQQRAQQHQHEQHQQQELQQQQQQQQVNAVQSHDSDIPSYSAPAENSGINVGSDGYAVEKKISSNENGNGSGDRGVGTSGEPPVLNKVVPVDVSKIYLFIDQVIKY